MQFWNWIVQHWILIATIIGLYGAVAGVVNKTWWPKPKVPPATVWMARLHYLLIDGPGLLPSINMRGIFGLPINIPFYPSVPAAVDDTAKQLQLFKGGPPPAALLVFGILSVLVSACATGTASISASATITTIETDLKTAGKDVVQVSNDCGQQALDTIEQGVTLGATGWLQDIFNGVSDLTCIYGSVKKLLANPVTQAVLKRAAKAVSIVHSGITDNSIKAPMLAPAK